jgi:hypothetical protein
VLYDYFNGPGIAGPGTVRRTTIKNEVEVAIFNPGLFENIDKSAPAGDPRSTWPVKSNQLYLDHSKGKNLFLFCQPWGDIFLKYRENIGMDIFFTGNFRVRVGVVVG